MNIVVVTDSYYPEMSAPAACMDKFIQKLKLFHSIDIINSLNGYHFQPLNDPTVKVHHVANMLWKIRIFCEYNIKRKKYISLNKFLIKLFRIRSFMISVCTYPFPLKWRLKAYYEELERLYMIKHIDVIISISDPICCTFSVMKFKKRHPEVKWISWFTDPFTYQPTKYRHVLFKKHRRMLNYRNEKEAYDMADYNLFTEELYKLALNEFHQPISKTFKIKYVLNRIPCTNLSKIKYPSGKIGLVYAGLFLRDKRNPNYCLSVLSQIPEIIFDMYVPYSNCADIVAKYTSSSIRQLPSVDRKCYTEIISNEYDILVNIGNNFSLQIPSKMLELLSTGRPIINFYQMKDVHYEMIEKYPLGINIGPYDMNVVENITRFCHEMKDKRLSFEEVEALFPENTLTNQLAVLESLINEQLKS